MQTTREEILLIPDFVETNEYSTKNRSRVIIQRFCHLLIEKGKCHPYERKGDIEQQGTETTTGIE